MPSLRLWTTPFPSETIDRGDTHVTEGDLADDTSAAPFQQPDIVCFPEHCRSQAVPHNRARCLGVLVRDEALGCLRQGD